MPLISKSDDSLHVESDGSYVLNGEKKPPHAQLSNIQISYHNEEPTLLIDMVPNKGDSFLPYQAELFNNGIARIRQQNPHDGVDDLYLLDAKSTAQLIDDLFESPVNDVVDALNSAPPMQKQEQSFFKKVIGR